MYDYQNDNEQLSEENEVGTFPNGGNISSDFKLHKESLPQWAVDWARNRFNMDTKSVKFYIMDGQEANNSVALASGDNILVTSELKNDETVIKHELTHVYQQAIGTATESNAGDTSLEDEAVQVSKEGEISLAKNQTQSDRYILPREKTNVVQFLAIETIMGIAIVGVGIAAWLGHKAYNKLNNWYKVKRFKKIAEKTGADESIVRKLYNIFSWDKNILSNKKSESLNEFERICKVVGEKPEMLEQVREDNKKLEVLYGETGYLTTEKNDGKNGKEDTKLSIYAYLIENDFKGFGKENAQDLKDNFKIPYFKYSENIGRGWDERHEASRVRDDNRKQDEIRNGYATYAKLYVLTKGFKERSISNVRSDVGTLFGKSLYDMTFEDQELYTKLYNNGLREANSLKIRLYKEMLVDTKEEREEGEERKKEEKDRKWSKLFIELLLKTKCFSQYIKSAEEFIQIRRNIGKLRNIYPSQSEDWLHLSREIIDKLDDTSNSRLDSSITNNFSLIKFFSEFSLATKPDSIRSTLFEIREKMPEGSYNEFIEKLYERGPAVEEQFTEKREFIIKQRERMRNLDRMSPTYMVYLRSIWNCHREIYKAFASKEGDIKK